MPDPRADAAARTWAYRLVVAAGAMFLAIGLSHFIVPALFRWRESLPAEAIAVVAGQRINNIAYLYLFNADLLLYEVMLSALSIAYIAPRLRAGRRDALVWSTALSVFFLLRTPLQFLYFPATWPNLAQVAGAFLIGCLYGYPFLRRAAFQEHDR